MIVLYRNYDGFTIYTGKESFYNPTFRAYLDDSRFSAPASDEYWIDSVGASIRELN